MKDQDILAQISNLEKLIPKMQESQKESHVAMRKALRFVNYVKQNHPSIFERALEYAEKGE